MLLKINNVHIKSPHSFSEEEYDITKANRLANGDMSMEYICTKKKFLLSYSVLTTSEYNIIQNALVLTRPFFTVSIDIDGVTKTYTMYMGALKREAHIYYSGEGWVWKNITFNIIEK